MKVLKVEKKEKNRVELSILVSAEEFEKACERSYHMNASKINLPGFRKGKAPRKMIEKMYGPAVFYDDAMNICCDESYYEAIKEKGLEPVDRPDVTDLDVNKDKEFSYKAIVTVKPEGKIKAYKGLEAEKATVKVTEKEVEEEIERVRERNARQVVVEREVKEGDFINFDFDGYVDGKQFDGGKAENYDLKIGSGMFIPGFEEQLIGKKAGDNCDVTVTFPKDYQAKELAGKEAVFKCFVREVKENVKPELDDEFAKDVSEFDTLADYKADVKKRIHDSKDARASADFEEKLLDKLIEGFECDIPEVMFERQTDRLVEDFSYRITSQGMDMNSYLKMSGMDMQSLRKIFSVQAERNVKVRLALETVAKEENLSVSDEDV
ncbi:MAG: trigger factor, partial [Clostridia bacterium]|nr:trigger factor [Clostridia bacterium]